MTDKTLGAYKRTTPDPDETTGEALARLQAEMTRLLDEADAELRDEADGGVAAALIEKEAEQNDAADFATAEFARHAESGGVGMRKDAGDPNTWCVAYENPGWRVGIRSDIEMARDGWAPVRECPDPDDHILARDYAAMSDRATAWQKRAEKAEKERDDKDAAYDQLKVLFGSAERAAIGWSARAQDAEERADVPRPLTPDAPECDRHIAHIATQDRVLRHRNRTIRDLTRERDEARATKDMHKRRADEERARAEKAEKERDEARTNATYWENTSAALTGAVERWQRRAEEPRPLTPAAMTAREHLEAAMKGGLTREDIPNDMCDRLVASRADTVRRPTAPGDEYPRRGVRDDLLAALTEPPARPEGAEELQRAMADLEMDDPAGFADLLAERNIRVDGEDGAR